MDNIVGNAGDNFIDGSRAVLQGQNLDTLNNADRMDGGAGTDTLFVQGNSAAGAGATTITPNSLKNVEIVQVENLGGAGATYTLNLANGDASVNTVKVSNTTGAAVTVQNIQSALTNLDIENVNQTVTVTSAAEAVAGAEDTLNVSLSSVTGAAGISAAGYETVNISSNGTVTNAIGRLTNAALTTLHIAGDRALTLTLDDGAATNPTAALSTIDASAATAAVNVTLDAHSAQAIAFTGGTGNDTFDTNGTYRTTYVLNGGDGVDTLVLSNANATGTAAVQANVSNFENLQVGTATAGTGLNGVLNVHHFNANGLVLGNSLVGGSTANFATGTNNLNLGGLAHGNNTLAVNVAGTATTDVLNVTAGNATTAVGVSAIGAVTISGAETVNLSSVGAANTFAAFTLTDTAATEALIITGNQSVTFTGAVRADTIDASGMAGTAALLLQGGTGTTATAITGTANADTLIGSTAGDIINGGAGNDQLQTAVDGTAASASDILAGGAGNDTFTLIGNAAAATDAGNAYGLSARVTDFTVGTAGATDLLRLSATDTSYNAALYGEAGNIAANAAVVVQNIAQNTSVAAATGANVYKLTSGVSFAAGGLDDTFAAAIGSATVSGVTDTNGTNVLVTLYDTTNSRAVVATVNTGADQDLSALDAGSIRLVATVDMSAADYAGLSATHFANFL